MVTTESRFLAPRSKTQYVLNRLRRDIELGTVHPGEALRQTNLASRYGVSATPVREALRILEAEGSVQYSPHKGATVAQLDDQSMSDLYQLRAATESLVTRLAVDRIDAIDEQRIRELHERITESIGRESGATLSQWNRDLHFAIYAHGSAIITAQLIPQWRLFPPQVTIWEVEESARELDAQHEEIISALTARDGDRAAHAMAEHILTAQRLRRNG